MFLINPCKCVDVSYLVNNFMPVVAYSLDKISSLAPFSCRVRRLSDNEEKNIGWKGQRVNTNEIESFVGVGNDAFLVKIYNQGVGGAGYDRTQPIASNQGKVKYKANTVYFDMEGLTVGTWKPSLESVNNIDINTAFMVKKDDNNDFNTVFTLNEIGESLSEYNGLSQGNWKEMIFFNSNETSNKDLIETDINERL